jgi:hypothetical protein
MTLVPAYGRDYKSGKDVKADFAAGKDFTIADYFSPDDGRVTNREDLLRAKVRSVNIRYARLTKIVVIPVK